MGFFDQTTVNTLATVSMPVLDPKSLPNAILAGAVQGIASGGSIPEYVMEAIAKGLPVRVGTLYGYGEKGYVFGSPSGETFSSNEGLPEVTAIINSQTALYGGNVVVEYSQFEISNPLHFSWEELIRVGYFNDVTNEIPAITVIKGGLKTYLADLRVFIPESMVQDFPDTLHQYGTPAKWGWCPSRKLLTEAQRHQATYSPISVSNTITVPHCVVDYEWETSYKADRFTDPVLITNKDSYLMPLPNFVGGVEQFHVKYIQRTSAARVWNFWKYRYGSGVYPTLDALFKAPQVAGSFFQGGQDVRLCEVVETQERVLVPVHGDRRHWRTNLFRVQGNRAARRALQQQRNGVHRERDVQHEKRFLVARTADARPDHLFWNRDLVDKALLIVALRAADDKVVAFDVSKRMHAELLNHKELVVCVAVERAAQCRIRLARVVDETLVLHLSLGHVFEVGLQVERRLHVLDFLELE